MTAGRRRALKRLRTRLVRRARRKRLSRAQTRRLVRVMVALLPASWGLVGAPVDYVGTVAGHPGCYEVAGRGEFLIVCADGFIGP